MNALWSSFVKKIAIISEEFNLKLSSLKAKDLLIILSILISSLSLKKNTLEKGSMSGPREGTENLAEKEHTAHWHSSEEHVGHRERGHLWELCHI